MLNSSDITHYFEICFIGLYILGFINAGIDFFHSNRFAPTTGIYTYINQRRIRNNNSENGYTNVISTSSISSLNRVE